MLVKIILIDVKINESRLLAPVSGTCLSYWSYQAIIPSWTVGIFALGRMDQNLPCLDHIADCRVTTDEERNMERGMGGFWVFSGSGFWIFVSSSSPLTGTLALTTVTVKVFGRQLSWVV